MNVFKSKSKYFLSEDYWAIWIGALILLAGIVIYLFVAGSIITDDLDVQTEIKAAESAPFKTLAWYKADIKVSKLTGAKTSIGKSVHWLLSKPKSWVTNPVRGLIKPANGQNQHLDRALMELKGSLYQQEEKALLSEENAEEKSFKNHELNEIAMRDVALWWEMQQKIERMESKLDTAGYNVFYSLIPLMLIFSILLGMGAKYMGDSLIRFIVAFLGVFILAVFSYLLASQADMKSLGISYAIWAILLGLIISNTIGTPTWMKPAVKTEFYIKTGLVLLGAEILLGKIMAIGVPGIFVSWVVTPVVLVSTFWFGQKILKIGSKTLNITISADMSVCGVSAAIATAAACRAKKEELTLAVGLSMIFTSVMMVAMPAVINALDIPEVLGGAWIGGTIDATGAVVAAGAFLGDKALNVAATIKMIQNVLIGVIAFGVAFYWATRVERSAGQKVGADEIWKRFPKFIIGFLGASLVFSILYAVIPAAHAGALIDHGIIRGFSKDVRGWLFCLAFVSIGLSVNFKELKHQFSGGKPLILYVCGQCLNLILTFLMAYLMFYVIFPDITKLI